MKLHLMIGLSLILSSAGLFADEVSTPAPSLWVAKENFHDFSFYEEKKSLKERPEWMDCDYPLCDTIEIDGSPYFYSILITERNYKELLVGIWTGGDCSDDYWKLNDNGSFESAYPPDEDFEGYSWSGAYRVHKSTYIEIGMNNSNQQEHNEAWLYYVPAIDSIIYKGTRSLDPESGEYYYHDPEDGYVHLKRCDSSSTNSQ